MSSTRVRARVAMVARYLTIAPLVVGLPIVRRIPWRIVWVVNAGSESDQRAYALLSRIGGLLGIDVGPIALFRIRGVGWGVVVATASTNAQLRASDERCRKLRDGVTFVGMDAGALGEASVVVLLSTGGDEGVASIAGSLTPGTVIVSDTHPKISRAAAKGLRDRGVVVYESALTRRGTRVVPKLPRWPADTIPGCVAQAIVECALDRTVIDQEAFTILGDRLFESRLDRPGGVDGAERAAADRAHS